MSFTTASQASSIFQVYANPTGPDNNNPENACFSKGLELGTDRTLLGVADSLNSIGISNVAISKDANGVSSWVFQFNENIETTSGISSVATQDTTKTVSVNFCVFFGLQDGAGVTVSYREVAVGLTISLHNEIDNQNLFSVGSAYITVVKDISIDYSMHGKLCGSNPPTSFKQGQEIALCLCTPNFPITRVAGIQELLFIADDNAATNQMAIVDGTVVNSQLTALGACTTWGFEHCCQVNAILIPDFFNEGPSGTAGARPINMRGLGDLAIHTGERRLEIRSVQFDDIEPARALTTDSYSYTTPRRFEQQVLIEYSSAASSGLHLYDAIVTVISMAASFLLCL